jgi:hypothetical protein
VVQAQTYTSTVSIDTTVFFGTQHRQALAESNTDMLLERFGNEGATMRHQQTAPPRYAEQDVLNSKLFQTNKTAKALLSDFEKSFPEQAITILKLQELMLHAVEQIGVAKFESDSLEIFAQDGYTVDCNGTLQARTFVYSDNLRYRVSHHATSFRTAFGCVWMRKTTLHLPDKARDSDQETKCVTSYTFYPNTWIQLLGIRNGLEAILTSAGRNWVFNCRVTVTRAVPEDSLIFALCRTGQTRAVEILLSKGLGSVVDTSPSGWKPLHVSSLHFRNASKSSPSTYTNGRTSLRRPAVMLIFAPC